MKHLATYIPVHVDFSASSARQQAWGRLVKLTSGGAVLSTTIHLVKSEEIQLSFEMDSQLISAMRAKILHVEEDLDGYYVAELGFIDESQRRRLAKTLTTLVSKSSVGIEPFGLK